MSDWSIQATFDRQAYELTCKLEYSSAQIMRIRVFGKTSSILLETNYPIAKLSKGKPIKWQLKEGSFHTDAAKAAKLLNQIMTELERFLKANY